MLYYWFSLHFIHHKTGAGNDDHDHHVDHMLSHQGVRKLSFALLLCISSALFYAASTYKLAIHDDIADTYFSESIQAATIAYATTRGVNAVVSVIKESELDVSPAGVGLTIAVGQVLDPIDDMTERLSSVLVMAIASLGLQKLGFEISVLISFQAIALLLLLCVPLLWRQNMLSTQLLKWMLKACFLLLLLRFMLPVSALVSDAVYKHWLQPNIEASLSQLALVTDSYTEMANLPAEPSAGFFASLTDAAADKITQTRLAFTQMVQHVEQIIAALLSLITAYLAMFVMQIMVLPIMMIWLLMSILKSRALEKMMVQMTRHISTSTPKKRRYIKP